MDLKQKIGERIRKIRKSKNLTLKQLGAMMGIADSSITVWEKGYNVPSLRMILLLCQKLNISADELIYSEEELQEMKKNKAQDSNKNTYEYLKTSACESYECKLSLHSLNNTIKLKEEQLIMKEEVINSKDEQIALLKKMNAMLEHKITTIQ